MVSELKLLSMASNTETTSHSSSQRKLSLMEDPCNPFFLHHGESPGAILMLNLWLRIIIQPWLEQWEWLWMPRVNLVLLMAPSLLQWQSHHSRNKPGQSAIQWSHHGSWILFHLISQLVSFTKTQLLHVECTQESPSTSQWTKNFSTLETNLHCNARGFYSDKLFH